MPKMNKKDTFRNGGFGGPRKVTLVEFCKRVQKCAYLYRLEGRKNLRKNDAASAIRVRTNF